VKLYIKTAHSGKPTPQTEFHPVCSTFSATSLQWFRPVKFTEKMSERLFLFKNMDANALQHGNTLPLTSRHVV
jgi:hypothetical protein